LAILAELTLVTIFRHSTTPWKSQIYVTQASLVNIFFYLDSFVLECRVLALDLLSDDDSVDVCVSALDSRQRSVNSRY